MNLVKMHLNITTNEQNILKNKQARRPITDFIITMLSTFVLDK